MWYDYAIDTTYVGLSGQYTIHFDFKIYRTQLKAYDNCIIVNDKAVQKYERSN